MSILMAISELFLVFCTIYLIFDLGNENWILLIPVILMIALVMYHLPLARAWSAAPDGSYVSGDSWEATPDGKYVGAE